MVYEAIPFPQFTPCTWERNDPLKVSSLYFSIAVGFDKNCVFAKSTGGSWEDDICSDSNFYICQSKPVLGES